MIRKVVQGNQACALGALAAGARFYAGYPISPSSEIGNLCSQIIPEKGGFYLQMEDEISSLAAVIGASLGGMKGFTATSGPGFSLMMENLGFAIMAEVPCVIINSMRLGPSTGVATAPAQGDVMQSRWGSHGGLGPIVLSAASVQECFDLTVTAFNLAERFRSPVVLLTDATVAHLREKIIIPKEENLVLYERIKPEGKAEDYLSYRPDERGVPPMAHYGDDAILRVTSITHNEAGFSDSKPALAQELIFRLRDKVEKYQDELPEPQIYGSGDSGIVVIAYGITARAAQEAVKRAKELGINVMAIQLTTIWPFPRKALAPLLKDKNKIIVPELNLGQLIIEIEALMAGKAQVIPLNRMDGEVITPAQILAAIKEGV